MVPMETEVDMEVEAGGVHDNGLLWESKKEKGKVIHIQHLVTYLFNTFIHRGQQKDKNEYCKHVKLLWPKEKHTNGLHIMKMTNYLYLRHIGTYRLDSQFCI